MSMLILSHFLFYGLPFIAGMELPFIFLEGFDEETRGMLIVSSPVLFLLSIGIGYFGSTLQLEPSMFEGNLPSTFLFALALTLAGILLASVGIDAVRMKAPKSI